ncbi:MAG TPA: hypothetical protein ENN39_01745 [Desulfonatronum sp.]|nr:hypothetical protein [Desulfonatronum sp.]
MKKTLCIVALAWCVVFVFGARPAVTQETLDGQKLVEERCMSSCHDLIRVHRAKGSKDRAGWERTVDRMIGKRSGLLNNEERTAVLEYLLSD